MNGGGMVAWWQATES